MVVRDDIKSVSCPLFLVELTHCQHVFGCVFLCVDIYLCTTCKVAKDKVFHCGQMHTILLHYCLLVRCDRGRNR